MDSNRALFYPPRYVFFRKFHRHHRLDTLFHLGMHLWYEERTPQKMQNTHQGQTMKNSSAIRPWACLAVLLILLPQPAVATPPKGTQGPLTQGSLYKGQVTPGLQVCYNGKPVTTTPQGIFVIGFGRDAVLNQRLSIRKAGSRPACKGQDSLLDWRSLILEPRTWQIQRIDGLDEKHVSPPKQVVQRIKKEAQQVREARMKSTARPAFLHDGFLFPVKGPITGVYGSQRILNGKPKTPHYGVDLAVPVGSAVRAPAAGRVVLAAPDLYLSGGTLVIDHGLGVNSSLLHLDQLLVKKGEHVTQGQVIARSGSTGRSTGPHLDWRINWYLVRLDPQRVQADFPNPAG